MSHLRAGARAAGLVVLATVTVGCSFFAPTVSVDRAGASKVYASLNENVLNSGEPSTATREVLHGYALEELYDDDPLAALRSLHQVALREPQRSNLFALSELAFRLGQVREDRDCYLASALYAWLFLFSTEDEVPASPYDRRFRWACDLYNSAVQRAFASPDGETFVVEEQNRKLPVGDIQVAVDWSAFPWSATDYPSLVPGDLYLIDGLSLRMRDSGLGVPLICIPATQELKKTPATALLRVSGSLKDMAGGVRGTIEMHSVFDARSVEVGAASVPLESDISVTLAYALQQSPLWKFSLSGLFSGEQAVTENRLHMIRPYQAGRIPVVFVHGTASNPAYWAEMFNTLLGDPELRERMQFWFFQYASGNPIVFSASTLRQTLAKTMAHVDPEGRDPALRRMILIGHSQGGLVVKLMVVDGSLDWVEQAWGQKVEDYGFSEDQMNLFREVFEFDAAPYVSSVVFICAPQRGSFRAGAWYSRWMAKLIAIPGQVQGLGDNLLSDESKIPPGLAARVPTSLDNMNPNSPMLRILLNSPIKAGITSHSIIAIGDADADDPESLAEADDGIVEYSSAHIDGVESELLVNASHSCQDNPLVIQEVRRILHEQIDHR